MLDLLREQKPSNPIVITGDAHVHSVRNVPPSFESFDGTPVAVEFMGTSISTNGDPATPSTTFGGDPKTRTACSRAISVATSQST